mgnify:CR=1 FL=1
MSIIIHIYYTGKNGAARKFAEEMISLGIVKKILEESGNEGYEYFLSVNDPETLLLVDRWKDQKALDEHHASPMMKKIFALREKYDLHMRVERFISEDTKLSDENEAFIRK